MSATGGKVALVHTATPLGCNGGSTPCPPDALAQIVDLVGYGNADFFEGAGPAPAPGNTTSGWRDAGGCAETDQNAADFGPAAPAPHRDDDATGDVETSGSFDPSSDGIDFYESLEATRGRLNNAVAVGLTSSFGEIPVVGDRGERAGLRSARGGLVMRPNDLNPERVHLNDALAPTPAVNVADRFPGGVRHPRKRPRPPGRPHHHQTVTSV
jgi:hypothetical protein